MNKHNVSHGWDCVEDAVVRNYQGQKIIFADSDGNDANHPVILDFVSRLSVALNLQSNQIEFHTDSRFPRGYSWVYKNNNYQLDLGDHNYNCDLSQAKFVGCLAASRPSVMRARVIYELDREFGADAFITCNPQVYADFLRSYTWCNNQPIYANELAWLERKEFYKDMESSVGGLNFQHAAESWLKIWNQYKIEVVMETVEHHNEFFTDKVAKVLMTGKPFVLLSGRQSLKRLREFGFVTFSHWINETYDNCLLPSQRIAAMMQSLKQLYNISTKSTVLNDMCSHARQNIDIYRKEFGINFPNRPYNVQP